MQRRTTRWTKSSSFRVRRSRIASSRVARRRSDATHWKFIHRNPSTSPQKISKDQIFRDRQNHRSRTITRSMKPPDRRVAGSMREVSLVNKGNLPPFRKNKNDGSRTVNVPPPLSINHPSIHLTNERSKKKQNLDRSIDRSIRCDETAIDGSPLIGIFTHQTYRSIKVPIEWRTRGGWEKQTKTKETKMRVHIATSRETTTRARRRRRRRTTRWPSTTETSPRRRRVRDMR